MHTRALFVAAIAFALVAVGCAKEDDAAKAALRAGGFGEPAAAELSRMELTKEEVDNLVKARQNGLDEASLTSMVKAMHEEDLRFVIGTETQLLTQAGMGATAITQLVQMGAIPRWADDMRALKEFGVDDVTIVEIAKLRFVENKEILSGGEYTRLKQFGISDAGLLTFARKGGTPQQLETLARELAMGKPEAQAMQTAGIK
ncbi:MAG TPA: hypothetical protein VNA88_03230 [Candidatus Kapabacteria bacterium]|nr:hypothetical protein [Candidatus Kapabacteria bacterium]